MLEQKRSRDHATVSACNRTCHVLTAEAHPHLKMSTYHSAAKAPITISETSFLGATRASLHGKRLMAAYLIIIDECSMLHEHHFACLDRSLRHLCQSQVAFAGKIIVLAGDFAQTLPVVVRGNQAQIMSACFNASPPWPLVTHRALHKNMRLFAGSMTLGERAQRKLCATQLNMIGNGTATTDEQNEVEMPSGVTHQSSLQRLIDAVYPNMTVGRPAAYHAERAILTSKNTIVDMINDVALASYPGKLHNLLSIDAVRHDGDAKIFSDEYLHSLNPSGLPPHDLKLKIGVVVMLIRNMSTVNHDCNGTRYIVKQILPKTLVLTRLSDGGTFYCFRIKLAPSDCRTLPVRFTRLQYPGAPRHPTT